MKKYISILKQKCLRLLLKAPFLKNNIYILKPVVSRTQEHTTITYSYYFQGEKFSFTNKFTTKDAADIYVGVEGLISIFIPHCILTGKTIYTMVPVDKTFRHNLQKIVHAFQKSHKDNTLSLKLKAPTKMENKKSKKANKSIATFTLGVDSFYTLYSKMNELDAILFVIGFDIQPSQQKLLQETLRYLKLVAQLYHKELVICESSLKSSINHVEGFEWGEYFHGVAIINIAYCISKDYTQLLIASSYTSSIELIWGSAYDLDVHYSSSFFSVIHFGDLSRTEKIKFIINYDERCLQFLRVCWENKNNSFNCTNCEKCLRTLYTIELLGFKEQAKTFDTNVNGKEYWNHTIMDEEAKPHQLDTKRQIKLLEKSKLIH